MSSAPKSARVGWGAATWRMRRIPFVVVALGLSFSALVGVVAAPGLSAAAVVPATPTGGPYWPGWDIARAVAIAPDATVGFVLDGFGGLHGFGYAGHAPPRPPSNAPYWPGWDVARGLALRDASSGYVIDAFGGLHPFGGAPAPTVALPYHLGQDTTRGITLSPDGTGAYVVDRAGGVVRAGLGGAPAPPRLTLSAPLSVPIAADLAVLSDGSGGFVLDGFGALHHLGVPSVVPISRVPWWPGWDIARGIAVLPDRSGGFVLDGYGGLHGFALGNGAPQLNVSTFLSGLTNPWDLGFSPDGWVIYTQRPYGIFAVRSDGTGNRRLLRPSDLLVASEAGAMGLALDPNFASNRRVYVCFASRAVGHGDDVRLSRFVVNANWTGLTGRRDLMTGLPINPVGQLGRHSGCRPRFGPDGYLWIGTGDSAVGTVPQDLHSLGAKVLRIDTNGVAAPDNPFYALFADPRIYSYGHRNVQGLAFSPAHPSWHGISIAHGPGIDDEANRLVPGNFGRDPIPGYDDSVPMTDLTKYPSAISAVWSSGDPTIAPSGATFLTGARWRSWRDALAVGVLKGSHLRVFLLRADGSVRASVTRLATGVRLRTPVQGPDGNLYVTTDNRPGGDVILRVKPT